MGIIGKTHNISKRKISLSNASVEIENISEDGVNQRIDNFFFKRFKKVPKSHIYQLLRSGQVRVNGKRISFHYRLQLGDALRIPPIFNALTHQSKTQRCLKPIVFDIIFEDDGLLVVNKPSGLAVHGGSGVNFGVIEQLRGQRPECKFLELVHRLDRETSGVLLLAKKRSILVELHRQIRFGQIEKRYQVMVKGRWPNARQNVKLPLIKYSTAEGERRVIVATDNKKSSRQGTNKIMSAHTVFDLINAWRQFSLLVAELKTGRTHQIRVHLAHLGFPIVGDDKYGDFALNKQLAKNFHDDVSKPHLSRMFLHAHSMTIKHPSSGKQIKFVAPLPADLRTFVISLEQIESS